MKVNQLKLGKSNPRQIRDERFTKLKQSIAEFPKMMELRPIVYEPETMQVLGGNMRLRAIRELGMTEVPDEWVRSAADLTEEERKRFVVVDNVGFGEWDYDVLANEWDGLPLVDWGLELPGDFGKQLEAVDDDYEIPEQIETDIVLGDLFQIGPHRLMCGDSTDSDMVAKLMGGAMADLYITDPPYGVAYVGKTKDALTIKNDDFTEEQTHQLWRDVFNTTLCFLKDGAAIYATVPAGRLQVGFMQVMLDADCLRQCMVWNKQSMVMGHSDYHYKHEPILYGWKPGTHYFTKDRTKTTVFDFSRPSRNAEHPTMKPVELWSEMITNSTQNKAILYDSFSGSGTTMVAANQLEKTAYCMELDPKYCQVIIDRMKKLDPSIEITKI